MQSSHWQIFFTLSQGERGCLKLKFRIKAVLILLSINCSCNTGHAM
ncbi:hypothetical protein NC651_004462 [Populus alba x Populus x berolinensis]|nr:hypothetical protein NC651_004462 [Populus alba x Populus x berolinensis]